MNLLLVVALLAGGGLATSLAEYKFQYNLFDYIVEGVKKALGFLTKEELAFIAVEKHIQSEVARRLGLAKTQEMAAKVPAKNS